MFGRFCCSSVEGAGVCTVAWCTLTSLFCPWARLVLSANICVYYVSWFQEIILVVWGKIPPGVYRLVGLVVRRPPRERKIPGSNPACARIFSGSSHTSDLKIGTPVATLPGAWRYRVSTGTGRPGVSILWLGEIESLICNFYLGVAARKIVWADPSLRYTRMLLGRWATNKQTNPPGVCLASFQPHYLNLLGL